MTPRKAVKGYGKWRSELVETLPDGTRRYRIFKDSSPIKQRRRFMAEYEKRFRELYDQELNDREIGDTLGFSDTTVGKFRNKLGLPPHHKIRSTARRISEYHMQFMELYNQGLSDRQIGEALDFHKGTVSVYRRKKLGLPAHFKFGNIEIVFSEEEKKKIREMRSSGASINKIAQEFGISVLTMLKKCREMGMDTSRGATSWRRKEKEVIRLWSYLEDHGPTTQREIQKKLDISGPSLQDYLVNLGDIFERFKFAIGTGSGSYGGVKYKSYDIYGDLAYNNIGYVISLNDDPRLIDFIAERIPFKLETSHNTQALVQHIKNHIGIDRAQEVVRKMGYVYGGDIKKTPKGRRLKFTDEQLRELYAKKLNDTQIGAILGVSNSAISVRRKRLGLPSLYKKGEKSRAAYYALDDLYQVDPKL